MSPHLREDGQAMLDTDDLALWYALNRLMTNYWADPGPRILFAGGALRRWPQQVRGDREDQCFLCPTPAARQYHHASPGRQSSGIPGGRAARPGGRGDEPLPRRRSPAVSVGQAARDDRGFRGAMRARRRPALAFSIAHPSADFRRQRSAGFDLNRPATPVRRRASVGGKAQRIPPYVQPALPGTP